MEYKDIAAKLASKDGADQPMDIRTGAGLMEAGFDVRLIGDAEEELTGQGAAEADGEDAEVNEETFVRWLEGSAFRHGSAIARWWAAEPVGQEGGVARFKAMEKETAVDLLAR